MKPRRCVQDDSWSLMSSSAIDTRVEAASGTLLVIRYCWMLSLKNKAKQTLKAVQNNSKAEKLLLPPALYKINPRKKEAPHRSGVFTWCPFLWEPSLQIHTLLRTVAQGQDTPYTFPFPLLQGTHLSWSHSLRHCSFLINLPFTKVFILLLFFFCSL